MATKRSYTRDDLTHEDEGTYGGVRQVCSLCGNESLDHGFEIAHDTDCPLHCSDTLGVMVTRLTKPRAAICQTCPAEGGEGCMVASTGGWKEATHESLLVSCGRYDVQSGRQ